ncbi:PDR/VanB family oxidoreductase [Oceanobacter sp. 4_MG-2023]|uniref:PDR/VanB family oxidoreductase n=1 Tax=Oceanobacter sp. 4_MG-2023 TaxID=3062623 RepID=UPI002735CEED|nr:PDR/VanB family oxidoreductase [Oceanobacter sp. 4_MG-2023]MDP2547603.1 PDR/VanB family oxidoreductase [Oceanobacter sp. 4_MG-2023]
MADKNIVALVHGIRYEAQGIIRIELRPLADAVFPSFEPGAHIDLHLPCGINRSYSLLGSPHTLDRYVVAVLRDQNSRGGSAWIHDKLRVGTELVISAPRNHFPVDASAQKNVLLAGGIGITPIFCMYRELLLKGSSPVLIYCARSRAEAAMLDEITALGGKVYYHFDDESGSTPDLQALLRGYDKDSHFYGCGPVAMLDAFHAACEQLGYEFVHIERFTAAEIAASADARTSYEVELAQSGQTLQIQAGENLLNRLLDAGVDVGFACQEGLCGSCEVTVIDGEVDHRDSVLSPSEQATNTTMMVCVSGCKSAKLTLDL